MDDTPFINDGADTSLRKTVSLLNKIEAKTGSTTITGPVTVSNEVEVTNDIGNPIPVNVKDSVGADVTYITAGTAGDPSPNVVSVQGITSGVGINTIPDVVAIAQGIQYQLDTAGPITRPQDVGNGIQYQLDNNGPIVRPTDISDGIDYYLNNINGYFSVYDSSAVSALGTQADSVATSDVGVFSIISFIKRGMQNWTSLLAKIPALVSGRIPVDGSGVTQPVSGSVTVTQATNANLKGQAQILNSAGSLITYAESGTYGSPSVDVISVQNPQGTSPSIATFTSTTPSSTLVSATTARKVLTIYNSGSGDLYISPTSTCTTTNFQVKLASGDYWECPAQQVTLGHTAVYGTAGTAYVTTIS